MGQYGVVVAAILQAVTTFCMCYLVVYKQWVDHWHNIQHLVNELFLYALLCVLLTISATVDSSKQQALGIFTIILIVAAIIFNLVVCAYTSLKHLKLVL